jgi:hypothetical protein
MSFYRTKPSHLSYDKPIIATKHNNAKVVLLLAPILGNNISIRYKWFNTQTGEFTAYLAQTSVEDAVNQLPSEYTIYNADLVVGGGE